MENQVRKLLERMEKVESLLSQDEVLADQKQFRTLAQEHSYLAEIKDVWQRYQSIQKQLAENGVLLKQENDPAFVEIIRQEITDLEGQFTQTRAALENLLVPPDPRDSRNIILELRAGTGGDEAALFVGDCVRMYKPYADQERVEIRASFLRCI